MICPKAGLQLGSEFSPRQGDLTQAWVDGLSQAESFSGSGSARVNTEHTAGKNSRHISRNSNSQDEDNRPALNDSCMWGLCCQGLYPQLHVALATFLKESATDIPILEMGKLRLGAMNELSWGCGAGPRASWLQGPQPHHRAAVNRATQSGLSPLPRLCSAVS